MNTTFKKLLNDYIVANLRTIVPVVIGTILAWLAEKGISFEVSTNVMTIITATVISAYYALFAALERFVSRRFGWFLGLAKPPTYTPVVVKPASGA